MTYDYYFYFLVCLLLHLSEQKTDASELKYRIQFEMLKTNFNQLLQALADITDEAIRDKYQGATKKLIAVMEAKV